MRQQVFLLRTQSPQVPSPQRWSARAQQPLAELSVGAALLPVTELAQMFPLEQAGIAACLSAPQNPGVQTPAEPTEPAVLVVLAVQIALRLVLRPDDVRTQAKQLAAAPVSALQVPAQQVSPEGVPAAQAAGSTAPAVAVAAGLAEPAVAASVLEAVAGFAVPGSAGAEFVRAAGCGGLQSRRRPVGQQPFLMERYCLGRCHLV